MHGSRGDRPHAPGGRADPAKLADWEARTFGALRRHRDATTVVDDELPDDPMPGDPETRSALDRLRRA